MTICNESGDIQLVTCSVCGEPVWGETTGVCAVLCEACEAEGVNMVSLEEMAMIMTLSGWVPQEGYRAYRYINNGQY